VYKRQYLSWWGRLYLRHPERARRWAWRSLWLNAQAVDQAQAVILIPGGFLNAYRWTNTDWLFHTPVIHLAAAMGRPASLGPCTIGPFAGPSRRLAARVLGQVDQILLRETLSLAVLDELGVSSARATVCRDVAFQYAEEGLAVPRPVESHLLGVSVREHNFPGAVSIRAEQTRYLEAVAGAIGRVLDCDPQAKVLITAQTGEDVEVSERLARLLASDRVELDLTTEDPDQLVASYRRLRLMLGTRMHANILAMCSGTPVVAIGYDPKTRGVMASLDLEEWVFDIDQLDGLSDALAARWTLAAEGQRRVQVSVAQAVAELNSIAAQLLD
jgi:colanic acid/amylovoran biosynthesis protein